MYLNCVQEKKPNLKNNMNTYDVTPGLGTTHDNKNTYDFPIESRVLITRRFSFIIIYKTRRRYKIYYIIIISYCVVVTMSLSRI